MTHISAAAISAILKRAGFKRRDNGTHWSPGFEVQQNLDSVSVCYSSSDTDEVAMECIRKIAETINSRPDQKYFAKPDDEKPAYICTVVISEGYRQGS